MKQQSEVASNELIDRIRCFGKSVSDMSISFNELAKAAWRLELTHYESLYLLSHSKCVLYRLKRERSLFIVRCYWSKKLGDEINNLKMKHRTVMYIKSVLK